MRSTFLAMFVGRLTSLAIVLLLGMVILLGCQAEVAPLETEAVSETSSPAAPALPTTAPTEAVLPVTGATEAPTAAPTAVPPTAAQPEATQPAAAAVPEASLSVFDDPVLGPILVGNNGMTLYMFTKDEPNKSNCEGECLEKWPPLVTQGSPTLGEGVDPALVGTAELPDGSLIVTYNEMPLYYWFEDFRPGNTFGQGVGEVWYVVSPEGEVIETVVEENTTPSATSAPATTAPAADAAAAEPTISVFNDPVLGPILVGDNGMTLYMFDKDEPDKSNCNADCLKKWPPLLTQGSPILGEGVDATLIGAAALADGTQIVTYNQMPLYYWVDDTQPGDTTGQGVGDVWWVVTPAGTVVRAQAPAATAAPASSNDNSDKESKDNDPDY